MRRIPGYVVFMLILTGAYLSVEVPFSVYLNLFMSGAATAEDMKTVETFGRLLTGIAVAIAIVGYVLPRYHAEDTRPGMTIAACAAYALIAVAGTFFALDFYAQATTDRATPHDMHQAYKSVLARSYIAHNGIAGAQPDNENPAWRSMLATVAVAVDHSKFQAQTAQDFAQIAQAEASAQVGSQAEFRKRFFGQVMEPIEAGYEDYAEGSRQYAEKIAAIDEDGQREWNSYIADLRSRFPEGIPLRGWTTAEIRGKVMERLPVSSSWNITDRPGFLAAYRKTAGREIRKAYADQVQLATGSFIEPGLSLPQFTAQPAIQSQVKEGVRDTFGLKIAGTIRPDMSPFSFRQAVYLPILQKTRADMLAMATDEASFQREDLAEQGRAAFQAATLPGLAILLSLAGAALHIFKFSSYAFQAVAFATQRPTSAISRRRYAFGGAVLATLAVAAYFTGNTGQQAKAYSKVSSGPYAATLRSAMALQPGFKIAGATLQTTGLWSVASAGLPTANSF